MSEMTYNDRYRGVEIAVIGMAGRFPGAGNINEFWENLKNGVESIGFLSEAELEQGGIPSHLYNLPNYVKTCGGQFEGFEEFDAVFFDYTPMEAEILDPQVRLFHECCWQALEDAGYYPRAYQGLVGVFAGAEDNTEWKAKVLFSGGDSDTYFTRLFLSNKDFVGARVSYKLNLHGPSYSITTGCSTSLVAIHLACRALLGGECDMALAGGAYVRIATDYGYLYTPGMLTSADGHVHAFDANASGTVFGGGVGVVLLKRLEDARADNDHIYALVRGSAANNDGNRKVNFAAPGIKGQVEVIQAALQVAGIDPAAISYIETHGTGTKLGDPIEMNALNQVFKPYMKNPCPIGSVKTNIGHLDVAAGAAGFIKIVLMLKHKFIPPSLNFEIPNPEIDFDSSPFYVNTRPREWQNASGPLRGGLSSFGFGGTNVHAILEEAPVEIRDKEGTRGLAPLSNRQYQLILLSAKTPTALDKMIENLAEYLKKNFLDRGNPGNHVNPMNPGPTLADVAYTLQTGREAFPYRQMFLCTTPAEAVDKLLTPANNREAGEENIPNYPLTEENNPVVFLFSGQGSQYVNMGKELYLKEPSFRQDMDEGFAIHQSITGRDIKEVLYPGGSPDQAKEDINTIENSGPIKLIFEYCLARLLMKWGIHPAAVLGHSFGEYTAATLAGVFSLEHAMRLVVLRARLMLSTPPGGMMSVTLSPRELEPLLNDDIALAAENSPSFCFVSGTSAALDNLQKKLEPAGHECIRINFPRAAHSPLMEPITAAFKEGFKRVKLHTPTIPYMSAVRGDWAVPEDIASPGYWASHLVNPVRYSTALDKLLINPHCIFIQVGPDRGLGLFLNQHPRITPQNPVINLIKRAKDEVPDSYFLFQQLGILWQHGITPDWQAFYAGEKRQRQSLPTYPFDRQRYWIEGQPFALAPSRFSQQDYSKREDVSAWLYIPSWKRCPRLTGPLANPFKGMNVLVFTDTCGIGDRLASHLHEQGSQVTCVKIGSQFQQINPRQYQVNCRESKDYLTLFRHLEQEKNIPQLLIHCWLITGPRDTDLTLTLLDQTQDRGFFSMLHLAQSIGELDITPQIQVKVITDNMLPVMDEEALQPEKATIIGAVKVIPLEYANLNCQLVDIILPPGESPKQEQLFKQLLTALDRDFPGRVAAIRGNHSWTQIFEPAPRATPTPAPGPGRLKPGGVYLITGGFGGIGYVLAQHLAKTVKARLVLTGRTPIPPKNQWQQWLDTHGPGDPAARKIRDAMALEQEGAEVLACAGAVDDERQMHSIIDQAKQHFGTINGIIHTAGLVDYAGVIQLRTREMSEKVLAPKVRGTVILHRLTREFPLDFFFICSSLASLVPSFGEVGYIAANVFEDIFAHYKMLTDNTFTTAANWDSWQQVGAAVEAFKKKQDDPSQLNVFLKDAILPDEGIQAFNLILENPYPQTAVSTRELEYYLRMRENSKTQEAADINNEKEKQAATAPGKLRDRPKLSTPYAAPRDDREKALAVIWADYFGLKNVGIEDDFFELGGDSLMATVLTVRIFKGMKVRIPLVKLFQEPTIKALAQYIQSQSKETYCPIRPVEKKEFYPLSPAQKRVYILQHMNLSRTDFNVNVFVSLQGNLDTAKLEKAFTVLLERHEGLRTSFQGIDGEIVQRVHNHKELNFTIPCRQSREQKVQELLKDFVRPFGLGQAPLFRAEIIKLEAGKQILMTDFHHIISDGMSMSILVEEFIQLYQDNALTPLHLQYKDYSQWQSRKEQVEARERQETFWLKEFENHIPMLNLYSDFQRPTRQTDEGDTIVFEITPEQTRGLKELARSQEITFFMILLAILNILLHKLSHQEDIVVGTAVLNRRYDELMPLFGVFVNTLALRNFPRGSKTCKEFLTELKVKTIESFENQDYQFGDLVERLKIKKVPNRNPLFDVMFQWQNVRFPEASLPGLKIASYNNDQVEITTRLDLHFTAIELPDRVLVSLIYKTRLFKIETIQRFIEYFKRIAAAVIDNPAQKLSEIEILSKAEKKKITARYDIDLEEESGWV